MLDHFFIISNTNFVNENYLQIVDTPQSVATASISVGRQRVSSSPRARMPEEAQIALDQVHHATEGVRNLAIETRRLGGMVVASGVDG
jgi:hypothetical protein